MFVIISKYQDFSNDDEKQIGTIFGPVHWLSDFDYKYSLKNRLQPTPAIYGML